jgi:hypothetical protein
MDCNVIELPERSCRKPIDLLVGNRLARLRGLYGITTGILGEAYRHIRSRITEAAASGRPLMS